MNRLFLLGSFTKLFMYCTCLLFFTIFVACKKYKTVRTTVDNFWIAEYEFKVIRKEKVIKKTNEVVEETTDTILVNLCELCSDCDEIEDDTGYRR